MPERIGDTKEIIYNKMKNKGPTILPRGTPDKTGNVSEKLLVT